MDRSRKSASGENLRDNGIKGVFWGIDFLCQSFDEKSGDLSHGAGLGEASKVIDLLHPSRFHEKGGHFLRQSFGTESLFLENSLDHSLSDFLQMHFYETYPYIHSFHRENHALLEVF